MTGPPLQKDVAALSIMLNDPDWKDHGEREVLEDRRRSPCCADICVAVAVGGRAQSFFFASSST